MTTSRSSVSCSIAARASATWPLCGGSNVPPSRPVLMGQPLPHERGRRGGERTRSPRGVGGGGGGGGAAGSPPPPLWKGARGGNARFPRGTEPQARDAHPSSSTSSPTATSSPVFAPAERSAASSSSDSG